MCQCCMMLYDQMFDVDMMYWIVVIEEEVEEFLFDDDEVDVIVGLCQFDFVDLIEEELLFLLLFVFKYEVCLVVYESFVLGVSGFMEEMDEVFDEVGDEGKWLNLFVVLEVLKKDGDGIKKY